jgi:hypothetical protein
MVDRTHTNLEPRQDKKLPTLYSQKRTASDRIVINNSAIDDVIATLANAHENRRARQVGEWERMPRQYVH